MNLAHRYQDDLTHPRHVAHLSLEILDGLVEAGVADADAIDRELLWAAGMLHDIGTAIDYDDHHKHSRYLILNARLPGFTPRELHLVGLIARYHRKGEPDASELGALAEKGDEQRLALLAGTIRLAEQLERSRDQTVASVAVSAYDGEVRIDPDGARRGRGRDLVCAPQRGSARGDARQEGRGRAKPVVKTAISPVPPLMYSGLAPI